MSPKPLTKYNRRTSGEAPLSGDVPILLRLGERVRAQRELLGWTQIELAEKCECSQVRISHIERGTRDIGIATLPVLAKALRTNVAALVG